MQFEISNLQYIIEIKMNFMDIDTIINEIKALNTNPVIVLEGTRKLPENKKGILSEFAVELSQKIPNAIFRTGNAKGSDEAFAEGVIKNDAKRLQYIIPRENSRRKFRHKNSPFFSADKIPDHELKYLIEISNRASPKNSSMLNTALINKKGKAYELALYLIRDTMKICGSEYYNLAKADFAFFFVNEENPLSGGTGHTIQVCKLMNVKYKTQYDFLK